MKKQQTEALALSRRDFLGLAGATLTAPTLGLLAPPTAASAPQRAVQSSSLQGKQPNILFVFTDQQRYIRQWPRGYRLPGMERLMAEGVTFHQHYCPAVMCTSSRAVLMTGLQTADNRMFENADMPYVGAMSTGIPTIGHMLRKAGYYTAYKGKWHLDPAFDVLEPERLLTREMEAYGFADFEWPGDGLVHTLGGYQHDQLIAGGAISWLRKKAQSINADGQPWALFVSLVNPHDIMYFNTDLPGESVQDNGRLVMHAARAPERENYRKQWRAALPASLGQPLSEPGRPAAHAEFMRSWGYMLGTIPPEPARWQRFSDFYYNSLQSVDSQLQQLLGELDALGLRDDTVIVFTADHGEMGGAHGLRGKGPFAYEESIHVPLIISHPQVKGGQHSHALTGHIDLVPTLLGIAGVDAARAADYAGRSLPGRDFSAQVLQPGKGGMHAVRDAVLFTYSGIATNDSEMIRLIAEAKAAGQDPKEAIKAAGYRPNLGKRGSLRTVFDGRYKYTRYFSPLQRNAPATLDEIYRFNDVELFDLQADPGEMHNLAAIKGQHAELVLAMNAKLEALIQQEIGKDDGREMPDVNGIDWSIDRMDL